MEQENRNQKQNLPAESEGARPVPAQRKAVAQPKRKKRRRELTHRIIVMRGRAALIIMICILIALCGRFAFLQLADPYHYAEKAVEQYTFETKLEAKRGTIYASDGTTKLAVSATTQTVFISPSDVHKAATEADEKSGKTPPGEAAQISMIAHGLAACLENYDAQTLIDKYDALGDAKTRYKYLVVKKDINEEEEAKVRAFISENGLELQIALEEGTKRYYPYSSLAAQLIGFVGTDNMGLGGIEYTYNEELSGVDGRAVRAQDANGNELAYNYESYIPAQDGLNLVTTIDWTVQTTVEKYLRETYYQHEPEGRVSCIVMDVDTGEILALALYPAFDLNDYTTLSPEYQAKLDAYAGEDKDSYRSTLMNEMWNNTIATQTYEPGSTFKVITAAMALETGSITTSQTFNCGGVIHVSGEDIHCWTRADHGYQNVAQALVNSCNPALAQIGMAAGKDTFKKYFEEFGYTKSTGSDLVGEVSSIYYGTTGAQFEDLELAVYSFGQTFKITMLQHIAALSAVANGGRLVTPHVAKYLTDQKGNVVKTFSDDSVRQVVSTSVCETILSYLVNSTANANVSGYNVVSKTGTSEKRDTVRDDDYISSCVTFAPAEDPRIAILVTVDTPNTAYGYYGSQVAAPAVRNILTDVLPYLGISPSDSESAVEMRIVSNYQGIPVEEARRAIEALGLECVVRGDGATVVSQMPRSDVSVAVGGKVILYTGDAKAEANVSVPDVRGKTPEEALRMLQKSGLNVKVDGIYNQNTENCYVDRQSIEPGLMVESGTVITITCRYRSLND
ncbi:MAG: PASTA domain-containing protein [Oscillospiraceae bacterium]|nr:PASTA domain-containing protein [Oscillospiraceae bacterium]